MFLYNVTKRMPCCVYGEETKDTQLDLIECADWLVSEPSQQLSSGKERDGCVDLGVLKSIESIFQRKKQKVGGGE